MELERLREYLAGLEAPLPEDLARIEADALANGVPILRKDAQALIRVLLCIRQPANILEIGTAVGFSASCMHTWAPQAKITTIENYEPRLVQARKNLAGTGVLLLEGDVSMILPTLRETYDFIFLDGPKGQYPILLPVLRELLSPDGLLVTDNVLQEGDILESRFLIRQRDRTIHARMREYLSILKGPDWESVILPVGDGVAVSLKK